MLSFKIRKCLIISVSFLLKIFYLFPVNDKKWVFVSFDGKQISCSPKYMYNHLVSNYSKNYTAYWILNRDVSTDLISNIIQKGTIKYYYTILTAKYIVTNDRLSTYLPIRYNQVYVNTWHGGGLFKKTFGSNLTPSLANFNKWQNRIDCRRTKLYLSSSKEWSNIVLNGTFEYKGLVCESGLPRNDLFFTYDTSYLIKIKQQLCIGVDEGIILYAPTYRSKDNDAIFLNNLIDVQKCISFWTRKFNKKFNFLFRGHHLMNSLFDEQFIMDVSDYPDMQELLLVSDVFISDFSSSLWDFSLTKRPSFLYAPDIECYDKNPGFESDYMSWPFPLAQNMNELMHNMDVFDEIVFSEKVFKYHSDLKSFEQGDATVKAIDLILTI